jgi:hypothetical protein
MHDDYTGGRAPEQIRMPIIALHLFRDEEWETILRGDEDPGECVS